MSATDHPPPSLAAEEEAFRLLLDPRGLLREDVSHATFVPPAREGAYAVFGQPEGVALPIEQLKRQSTRFFATRLGLTVDKRYDGPLPHTDAARVVVLPEDATARGTRLVYGRPVEPEDVEAARAAEALAPAAASGLSGLAARCKMLWLVVPASAEDRAALTLAAVLASVLLGPILAPGGGEIFGVRTARTKLESRARPYR